MGLPATAYIFLNGDFVAPPDWPERPGDSDLVIAADGGGRHVAQLGWPLHCLVGDFDSLSPDLLERFRLEGVEIFEYPTNKNEIDFELALKLARQKGYINIEVLGALGGRWDMTFSNLFLPKAAVWGSQTICFRHDNWRFFVLSGPANMTVDGKPGDLLSILPLGEEASEVSLSGCLYPLSRETLQAGLSRGVSNSLISPQAALSFEAGTLIVMHRASIAKVEMSPEVDI